MNSVQEAIKAHQNLQKALTNIPTNILAATKKLSEKLDIDYYQTLEIVNEILTPTKSPVKKRSTPVGFGGRINPKDMDEIKRRIACRIGDKKECYEAALMLLQQKEKWIAKKEFRNLGIKIMDMRSLTRLKRRINACLPTGYILQTDYGCYRATKYIQEKTK